MTKNTSSGKTPEMVTELLKKAVAEKGQSTVARESGIALYSVQRYLKGIGEPTTKTFQKLADYFGVSVRLLRGETGFYEWLKGDSFVNKFLLVASCHFEQVLKDDYRIIGEVFYLQVVVELAQLVTEMPAEVIQEDKLTCREDALKVIEKYEEYVLRYNGTESANPQTAMATGENEPAKQKRKRKVDVNAG